MRSRRRSPSRASNTIRRCCGPRASSKARSRSCATRLAIGAVLVVALLLITLRDWRGALVSFSAIPLALLTTVWILEALGFSLNTMTLGGLVVALGVVVDDAVIDVENILRRRRVAGPRRRTSASCSSAPRSRCAGPVFYATAAVAVAFLPILMMSGLQGAFFRPLSIAFLLAVGLSLAGRHERDAGDVRAGDGAARAQARSARFCSVCKRGQLRAIAWLQSDARARSSPSSSASGVAGIVFLPLLGARLLPDFRENYLIAHASLRARDFADRDRARRRADLQGTHRHSGRQERRRADRPRRERPGSGCAQQERIRGADRSAARAQRRRDRCRHPRCVRRLSRISSWRSIRCWPSASARRCPASPRRSPSA